MMEGQYGSSPPHKTTENGFKRKPPYSVETPYGFCLDLDFLKYVDDIEKGNTIKRVPIHRRSKGPRSSTLPRHLNLPGGSVRPSPWGSTGALGPRTRLSDSNHGYNSWTYDRRTPVSPTGFKSLAEMEDRIKAFDEQPLGEHIRPNLLRASSMPLTVLLRQSSETSEDTVSLRSSRDHLGGRDSSCEDIPRNQEFSGLLRRLTEALERVGELEMEMRVIPELKAQICILQEERERLHLGLRPLSPLPESGNGTARDSVISSWSQATGDLERQRNSNGCLAFPKSPDTGRDNDNPLHEWRSSTDLDELLTVTSLQAKVAALEQKLHNNGLELQRALRLLREQREESQRKDERIEHFSVNPVVWVCAEKVLVDDEEEEDATVTSTGDVKKLASKQTIAFTDGQRNGQHQGSVIHHTQTSTAGCSSSIPMELEEASPGAVDSAAAVHHIRRIKALLEEQWDCLCQRRGSMEDEGEEKEKGRPLEHPDPKVNSLQKEMMRLVDVLTACCDDHGRLDGDRLPQEAPKSATMKMTDDSAGASESIHLAGVNERCSEANKVPQDRLNQGDPPDQKDGHSLSEEMPIAQVHTQTCTQASEEGREEAERYPDPGPGTEASDGEDGGAGVVVLERQEQMESSSQVEQMDMDPGCVSTSRGSAAVSGEFMAACQFLKDHMENMDNPNNDMRKALVVLFHHWFGVAAEETAEANSVSLYLAEVKKTTPPLLAFLVNLADDNGNTALHYSLSHCNYGIVSLLLDTGVSDVDLQNKAGYTAVMLASLTAPDGPGGMEVVRRLMELGDVNISSTQTGQTALHLAVRHGRVVMVRLLLSCGARADVQDVQGTTALMFACERGHTHIVRLLLERGHCDLALTDQRGLTALSLALQGSHGDSASLLQAHAKARAL